MARRYSVAANIDWVTILLYIALVFLGWLNIYASVYSENSSSIFDLSQRYGKQFVWIVASAFFILLILITEARFFVFFSYLIYGIFIFLLFAVLLFGDEINGSKSWFVVGGVGLQPAEFGKFATALALAKFVSAFNFKMHKFSSLAIIIAIVLFPAFLIYLQNDTGTALVYFVFVLVLYREGLSGIVLFFALLVGLLFVFSLILSNLALIILLIIIASAVLYFMYPKKNELWKAGILFLASVALVSGIFLALGAQFILSLILLIGSVLSSMVLIVYSYRKRLKNVLLISIVFFGSLLFTTSVDYVFENVLEPHHQSRINELLGIDSDPLNAGYNVNQSKIAIGSGGFFGKGFLHGTQTRFNFVPEQSTDFIFCTVGEEWGFIGSLIVIGLFIALMVRLIFLAERQRSVYSRVYGYSVATLIFFHFLVNIGMTIGLMPVIGIPLPFFSYGGSSLLSFTILLFVFLRLDASRLDQLL